MSFKQIDRLFAAAQFCAVVLVGWVSDLGTSFSLMSSVAYLVFLVLTQTRWDGEQVSRWLTLAAIGFWTGRAYAFLGLILEGRIDLIGALAERALLLMGILLWIRVRAILHGYVVA